MPRLSAVFGSLAITCTWLVLAPAATFGHANSVVSMTPPDGSVVSAPIEQVVVTYGSRPDVRGKATLTTPDGSSREVTMRVDGTKLVIPFTPDEAGTWKFAWKVAQTDGHEVTYRRSLRVTAIDPGPGDYSADVAGPSTVVGLSRELDAWAAAIRRAVRAVW